MSHWDDIEGYAGWRKELTELLARAEEAAKSPEVEQRFEVSRRLNEFISTSRPNDEQIRALDTIAAAAAVDLMRLTIDERLKAIIERGAALAKLTKDFEAAAEAAAASAGSIRLERVRRVVQSLTESVEAVNELRLSLQGGADEEMAARLEQALNTLRELRNHVEGDLRAGPAPRPSGRPGGRRARKPARHERGGR